MNPQLSLRRLEIFCLVVETGGVTRAAEQLMIAQPSVSNQIRSLEQWFGAPLFTRTAGHLQPTEAGDLAYRWARETLARAVRVQRDVQDLAAGAAGRVVVAASMGVGSYLLPPMLTSLRAERDGAEITLHVAQPEQAIHAVELGEADFALVTWHDHLLPNTLTSEQLADVPMILCASPDGPPFSDAIELIEMASLPFVSVPVNVAFHKAMEAQIQQSHTRELNVVIRLGHAEPMKQAVIDHGWVTLMPSYCVEKDIQEGRLRRVAVKDLELWERIALVQRKDNYLSPLQMTALAAIKNAVTAVISPVFR